MAHKQRNWRSWMGMICFSGSYTLMASLTFPTGRLRWDYRSRCDLTAVDGSLNPSGVSTCAKQSRHAARILFRVFLSLSKARGHLWRAFHFKHLD